MKSVIEKKTWWHLYRPMPKTKKEYVDAERQNVCSFDAAEIGIQWWSDQKQQERRHDAGQKIKVRTEQIHLLDLSRLSEKHQKSSEYLVLGLHVLQEFLCFETMVQKAKSSFSCQLFCNNSDIWDDVRGDGHVRFLLLSIEHKRESHKKNVTHPTATLGASQNSVTLFWCLLVEVLFTNTGGAMYIPWRSWIPHSTEMLPPSSTAVTFPSNTPAEKQKRNH